MTTTLQEHMQLDGLARDPDSGVWLAQDAKHFGYSDGDANERYLQTSLDAATDLSSESFELERFIRDWPSEYHFSRRRSQLLKNFQFDPTHCVLEIGAGCGAITRFLGERFARVVSIEGSERRARIARTRTRDLANVEVVCAPFQRLTLRRSFDVVFVIGVLEYAAAFDQEADDPYAAFLRRCADCLVDGGVLVLAIENQFGLKYFAGMGEDHSGRPFDGLEGYASERSAARTFGKAELTSRVSEFFSHCEYYYPFPDYKLPSAVLAEAALPSLGAAGVAGVVSTLPMRDYLRVTRRPLFDEALAWYELAKNQLAAAVAPSFLLVASNSKLRVPAFQDLGVLYSGDRKPEFQTVTKIRRDVHGEIAAHKLLLSGERERVHEHVTWQNSTTPWRDQPTLALTLRRRRLRGQISLTELFEPCAPWFDWLRELTGSATLEAKIDGGYLDNIWKNTFIQDGRCVFIDQEWRWHEPISARVLIVRSAYDFINDRARLTRGIRVLENPGGAALITGIARGFGISLTRADFEEFVDIESRLREIVFGKNPRRARRLIRLQLHFPRFSNHAKDLQRLATSELSTRRLSRALSKLRRR